jgi:ribosomal protein L29
LLDGVLSFNPARIKEVRQDFLDIASALTRARPPN